MRPLLRCVRAAWLTTLMLHTAAQGRDLEPDPHAVWEKLDPLFRAHHPALAAARSNGLSLWYSLPADSVISGFVAFDGSRDRLVSLGARVGTQVGTSSPSA